MDFTKIASGILVIALAVALVVGSMAFLVKAITPSNPAVPTPLYCPHCGKCVDHPPTRPYRPDTFPTPNVRPGSQSGSLDAGSKDSK